MSEPIRRVPVEIDAQGQVKAQSVTSPIRFGVRAGVGVPPSKIIPIVFVPGIMGSNLKTKASKGKVRLDDPAGKHLAGRRFARWRLVVGIGNGHSNMVRA